MILRYGLVLLWLLLGALNGIGQAVSLDQLDKKSRKAYGKALKCLKKGHKEKAIKRMESVVVKNPSFTAGLRKLSGIYMDQGQTEKAAATLDQLMQISDEIDPKLAFSHAAISEEQGDYDAAVVSIDRGLNNQSLKPELREKLEHRKAELLFRKEAYANPSAITPVKLSSSVNTSEMEYHPTFNADQSMLFYVKAVNRNEDLYYATAIGDSFSMGQPIRELNTAGQEGAFSLSQDGKVLIFTGCNLPNSIGGCDLYISFKKGHHWTEPKNMGTSINSRWWDSTPTLAADNRTLYFSSRRPGGKGGADIWMVQLDKHNRWGTPVNLGSEINTAGNEEGSFIHADSKTLYFVSDGHVGLGSYDIFISRLNEKNEWQKPMNLGYPINTSAREGGLFINLSGQRAYYGGNLGEESADAGDLFYFDLPLKVRPDQVTYVKVEVRDAKTKGLIIAETSLVDLLSAEAVTTMSTDVNGKMLTTLKLGEYALNVSKSGYLFYSENIVVNSSTSIEDPFSFKVFLEPIPAKETPVVTEEAAPKIILKNIFFETGSAELLAKSDGELKRLKELLESNKDLKIKILGHTDNVGSDASNLKLSDARAEAVYDRLIQMTIDPRRLQYEGKGETQPIADNNTEEGRRSNRRTEFYIIK